MISAGQLIGVFVMCFVFILGAYIYGHEHGFQRGWGEGFELYKRYKAKYSLVKLPDEQMKKAQVKLNEKEGADDD